MGKSARLGKIAYAECAERAVRCPRCGIKLAEAKGAAKVTGLVIKCRRCHLPVHVEL